MERVEAREEHDKFKELCALSLTDMLSDREQRDLDLHLQKCESCRHVYEQYSLIDREGMAFLAAQSDVKVDAQRWDDRQARADLFAAIGKQTPPRVLSIVRPSRSESPASRPLLRLATIGSLAACTLLALTLGAYRMGVRQNNVKAYLPTALPSNGLQGVTKDLPSDTIQVASAAQISDLEKQVANDRQLIVQLRATATAANDQIEQLGNSKVEAEAWIRQINEEREQLKSQLSESEKAYQLLQADLSNLRADHNRSLLHTASLETEVIDLRTANRDQERRLNDDAQYLTSDRDIRELMGARKLYIADVFDVDSGSHTRKPFGRVFYTQSKSLVFYAFDLDHQPGVKNASVFQVWGQSDAEANGTTHPMNLGILFMDSESNRRWVLRSDDPKQLSEIDAVFVTVEPHGGSQKPTGKPLLYALLRKEANHP